jgi:signal transduction histidine kinase
LRILLEHEARAGQVLLQQDSKPCGLRYRDLIETLTRSIRRLGISPLLADGALALLLIALAEAAADNAQRWVPLSVALVALETLPLTFRRRAPVTVLIVVSIALLGHLLAGFHNGFFDTFAGVVAVYSVAAQRPRRVSLTFLALLPIALAAAFAVDWHNKGQVSLVDIPYNLLLFLSAWLLGDNLQTRRAYAVQLEERELLLERERQEQARAALAEERARIARELHDIVAHSVSIMVLQANAGERVAGSKPEQAAENFAAIQATGRQALSELRRLLGVLRGAEGAEASREPQPGLSGIEKLAEQARRSGVDTTVRVEGDPAALPEAMQLSAYRVIQEALTNTMRHAGASRADVAVRCAPRSLEVEVIDDGRHPAPADGSLRTGHGLIGMRERVNLFGGELEVGPVPDGGFRVMARFPVDNRPA